MDSYFLTKRRRKTPLDWNNKRTVAKFPNSVKIPQMGWNTVHHDNTGLFEGINKKIHVLGYSYYAPKVPESVAFTIMD